MFELPWEFSVPMPSYDYTEGVSGAGSWNSTPQRVRVYANELMEAGFMNESSARSAWKNTDKLEALIRTVNPRLPDKVYIESCILDTALISCRSKSTPVNQTRVSIFLGVR